MRIQYPFVSQNQVNQNQVSRGQAIKLEMTPITVSKEDRALLDSEVEKQHKNSVTTTQRDVAIIKNEAPVIGAKLYFSGYQPKVTIDLSAPDSERQYQYGELDNKQDIDAFLDQLDRLSPDQRDIMKQYKPSKTLLSILEKMDDETFSKFTQVLEQSFPPLRLFNNKKPEELFNALEGMSTEMLKDTVDTFMALSAQAQNGAAPTSLIPVDEDGREPILMHVPRAENGLDMRLTKGNNSKNLTDTYTDMLARATFSEDDLLTINTHLKDSDFEKSRGIVDMASLVAHNDKRAFFDMLSEADETGPTNIFSYIGQQVNYEAHVNYYQSSKGQYVSLNDAMPDDSARKGFHKKLLNAYEDYGLSWMNDMVEQVHNKPAQIQSELWSKLMDDVEEKPHLFKKSDSIEQWAGANISDVEQRFHARQIDDIHTYSYDLEAPVVLGTLTWAERFAA
ncbi:hypothetical protein [Pseudoalteromonas sp. MMG005]|uniref:hypothetical protein n=1 Tax=Pseudoalteromonas sp. MMG005 TaxID=2822682 RepID=UPI001B3A6109|nr:hypothetical protein [Pseudoalteromonas sp. MMG005]MBQ4848213.1 hypothetical protein [Pseudoalteromonas sp. MMG005]